MGLPLGDEQTTHPFDVMKLGFDKDLSRCLFRHHTVLVCVCFPGLFLFLRQQCKCA